MIDYPDSGYSPDNFKALVKASQMNKVAFVNYFKLSKAMFYRYQNGEATMQHDDWLALKDNVESYLRQKDVDNECCTTKEILR